MDSNQTNQQPVQPQQFISDKLLTGGQQKVKTTQEIADERIAELQGDQSNVKRGREEYAQSLRKKTRENYFQEKRKNRQTQNQQQNDNTQQNAVADKTQTQEVVSLQQNVPESEMQDVGIDTALAAIGKIADNEFIRSTERMIFKREDFSRLEQLINSDNILIMQFSCIGFRRLLSFEKNPPIQQVIDANLIPKFLSFFDYDQVPKLQFEAAWCVTNIASGDHEHVNHLINKGCIDHFLRLMHNSNIEVVEQAVWGLGNIAGDNPRVRDLVIAAGAVEPIANLLDQGPKTNSFVRNVSWTLANLCRGRPSPDFKMVRRAIPSLAHTLIQSDMEDILTDICWAFSYLTDGGSDHIAAFLETNLCPRLVQLLEHQSLAISVASMRTVGNILTGDDDQTQIAIDCGALMAFNRLIVSQKKAIRKEVCWSVSNVTAGNEQQIQACFDIGLIDKVIHLLQNDAQDIRKEAVWALSNCTTHANKDQFAHLMQKGGLKALVASLSIDDVRVLLVTIEGITNILEAGKNFFMTESGSNPMADELEKIGGVDKLEELQTHRNQNVYQRVVNLLERYYQVDNDGDDIMTMIQSSGAGNNGGSQPDLGNDGTPGGNVQNPGFLF